MTYTNPPNSPPVEFDGPVSFSRAEIAAACRLVGPEIAFPSGCVLDGAKTLWALAGNESSFGLNCKPRHEHAYCEGIYSASPEVVALTEKFGHAAHASFGPWQLMLVNVPDASPDVFATAEGAARLAAQFITERLIRAQGAKNLTDISCGYNSGTVRHARPSDMPLQYIAEAMKNYTVPMP